MNSNTFHSCPRCQIGHLQPGEATFSAVLNESLLSIGGVTAWTCDICQFREFDRDALAEIEQVTGSLFMGEQMARPSARVLASDFGEQNKSQRLKP
jgi:hypothetical protein